MTSYDLSTPVGDLASSVPGAAGLLRRSGISFCCDKGLTLAEAAAKSGIDGSVLLDDLVRLADEAGVDAPDETTELIGHIIERFHNSHRRDLPELIALAQKVEMVHGDHEDAPLGLADILEEISGHLLEHMQKEEAVLFPAMGSGQHRNLSQPAAMMRADHADQASILRGLEHKTKGFRAPEGACRSWQVLYVGLEKFADDMVRHMALENDVLFPRFEVAR